MLRTVPKTRHTNSAIAPRAAVDPVVLRNLQAMLAYRGFTINPDHGIGLMAGRANVFELIPHKTDKKVPGLEAAYTTASTTQWEQDEEDEKVETVDERTQPKRKIAPRYHWDALAAEDVLAYDELSEDYDDRDDLKKNPIKALLFVFKDGVGVGKGMVLKMLMFGANVPLLMVYTPSPISSHGLRMLLAHSAHNTHPSRRVFAVTHTDIAFEKPLSRLVSRYRVLDESSVKALLASKKCKLEHLPRMDVDDPVARYMGFTLGQVVHAVDADLYRIVVSSET